MHRSAPVVALIVALFASAVLVASCSSSGSTTSGRPVVIGCDPAFSLGDCGGAMCDYAGPAGIFEGRLLTLRGAEAMFQVDRLRPSTVHGRGNGPVPVAGKRLAVRYENGEQRYLRANQRYRVIVWWLKLPPPARFFSSVHTRKSPCSGGTIHVNGTTIDT